MAEVDPEDDAIERFVVRHYRYDPDRRERRHVVVAAFDNEPEFMARIHQESHALDERRASGGQVDPRGHITGVVLEPGHARLAANARLVQGAFRHGSPDLEWLERLDLPSNTWVMRIEDPSPGQPSTEDR